MLSIFIILGAVCIVLGLGIAQLQTQYTYIKRWREVYQQKFPAAAVADTYGEPFTAWKHHNARLRLIFERQAVPELEQLRKRAARRFILMYAVGGPIWFAAFAIAIILSR